MDFDDGEVQWLWNSSVVQLELLVQWCCSFLLSELTEGARRHIDRERSSPVVLDLDVDAAAAILGHRQSTGVGFARGGQAVYHR